MIEGTLISNMMEVINENEKQNTIEESFSSMEIKEMIEKGKQNICEESFSSKDINVVIENRKQNTSEESFSSKDKKEIIENKKQNTSEELFSLKEIKKILKTDQKYVSNSTPVTILLDTPVNIETNNEENINRLVDEINQMDNQEESINTIAPSDHINNDEDNEVHSKINENGINEGKCEIRNSNAVIEINSLDDNADKSGYCIVSGMSVSKDNETLNENIQSMIDVITQSNIPLKEGKLLIPLEEFVSQSKRRNVFEFKYVENKEKNAVTEPVSLLLSQLENEEKETLTSVNKNKKSNEEASEIKYKDEDIHAIKCETKYLEGLEDPGMYSLRSTDSAADTHEENELPVSEFVNLAKLQNKDHISLISNLYKNSNTLINGDLDEVDFNKSEQMLSLPISMKHTDTFVQDQISSNKSEDSKGSANEEYKQEEMPSCKFTNFQERHDSLPSDKSTDPNMYTNTIYVVQYKLNSCKPLNTYEEQVFNKCPDPNIFTSDFQEEQDKRIPCKSIKNNKKHVSIPFNKSIDSNTFATEEQEEVSSCKPIDNIEERDKLHLNKSADTKILNNEKQEERDEEAYFMYPDTHEEHDKIPSIESTDPNNFTIEKHNEKVKLLSSQPTNSNEYNNVLVKSTDIPLYTNEKDNETYVKPINESTKTEKHVKNLIDSKPFDNKKFEKLDEETSYLSSHILEDQSKMSSIKINYSKDIYKEHNKVTSRKCTDSYEENHDEIPVRKFTDTNEERNKTSNISIDSKIYDNEKCGEGKVSYRKFTEEKHDEIVTDQSADLKSSKCERNHDGNNKIIEIHGHKSEMPSLKLELMSLPSDKCGKQDEVTTGQSVYIYEVNGKVFIRKSGDSKDVHRENNQMTSNKSIDIPINHHEISSESSSISNKRLEEINESPSSKCTDSSKEHGGEISGKSVQSMETQGVQLKHGKAASDSRKLINEKHEKQNKVIASTPQQIHEKWDKKTPSKYAYSKDNYEKSDLVQSEKSQDTFKKCDEIPLCISPNLKTFATDIFKELDELPSSKNKDTNEENCSKTEASAEGCNKLTPRKSFDSENPYEDQSKMSLNTSTYLKSSDSDFRGGRPKVFTFLYNKNSLTGKSDDQCPIPVARMSKNDETMHYAKKENNILTDEQKDNKIFPTFNKTQEQREVEKITLPLYAVNRFEVLSQASCADAEDEESELDFVRRQLNWNAREELRNGNDDSVFHSDVDSVKDYESNTLYQKLCKDFDNIDREHNITKLSDTSQEEPIAPIRRKSSSSLSAFAMRTESECSKDENARIIFGLCSNYSENVVPPPRRKVLRQKHALKQSETTINNDGFISSARNSSYSMTDIDDITLDDVSFRLNADSKTLSRESVNSNLSALDLDESFRKHSDKENLNPDDRISSPKVSASLDQFGNKLHRNLQYSISAQRLDDPPGRTNLGMRKRSHTFTIGDLYMEDIRNNITVKKKSNSMKKLIKRTFSVRDVRRSDNPPCLPNLFKRLRKRKGDRCNLKHLPPISEEKSTRICSAESFASIFMHDGYGEDEEGLTYLERCTSNFEPYLSYLAFPEPAESIRRSASNIEMCSFKMSPSEPQKPQRLKRTMSCYPQNKQTVKKIYSEESSISLDAYAIKKAQEMLSKSMSLKDEQEGSPTPLRPKRSKSKLSLNSIPGSEPEIVQSVISQELGNNSINSVSGLSLNRKENDSTNLAKSSCETFKSIFSSVDLYQRENSAVFDTVFADENAKGSKKEAPSLPEISNTIQPSVTEISNEELLQNESLSPSEAVDAIANENLPQVKEDINDLRQKSASDTYKINQRDQNQHTNREHTEDLMKSFLTKYLSDSKVAGNVESVPAVGDVIEEIYLNGSNSNEEVEKLNSEIPNTVTTDNRDFLSSGIDNIQTKNYPEKFIVDGKHFVKECEGELINCNLKNLADLYEKNIREYAKQLQLEYTHNNENERGIMPQIDIKVNCDPNLKIICPANDNPEVNDAETEMLARQYEKEILIAWNNIQIQKLKILQILSQDYERQVTEYTETLQNLSHISKSENLESDINVIEPFINDTSEVHKNESNKVATQDDREAEATNIEMKNGKACTILTQDIKQNVTEYPEKLPVNLDQIDQAKYLDLTVKATDPLSFANSEENRERIKIIAKQYESEILDACNYIQIQNKTKLQSLSQDYEREITEYAEILQKTLRRNSRLYKHGQFCKLKISESSSKFKKDYRKIDVYDPINNDANPLKMGENIAFDDIDLLANRYTAEIVALASDMAIKLKAESKRRNSVNSTTSASKDEQKSKNFCILSCNNTEKMSNDSEVIPISCLSKRPSLFGRRVSFDSQLEHVIGTSVSFHSDLIPSPIYDSDLGSPPIIDSKLGSPAKYDSKLSSPPLNDRELRSPPLYGSELSFSLYGSEISASPNCTLSQGGSKESTVPEETSELKERNPYLENFLVFQPLELHKLASKICSNDEENNCQNLVNSNPKNNEANNISKVSPETGLDDVGKNECERPPGIGPSLQHLQLGLKNTVMEYYLRLPDMPSNELNLNFIQEDENPLPDSFSNVNPCYTPNLLTKRKEFFFPYYHESEENFENEKSLSLLTSPNANTPSNVPLENSRIKLPVAETSKETINKFVHNNSLLTNKSFGMNSVSVDCPSIPKICTAIGDENFKCLGDNYSEENLISYENDPLNNFETGNFNIIKKQCSLHCECREIMHSDPIKILATQPKSSTGSPEIILRTWSQRQDKKEEFLNPSPVLMPKWVKMGKDSESIAVKVISKDTSSPGPPPDHCKGDPSQLPPPPPPILDVSKDVDDHHTAKKEEDRVQLDRCLEIYPETLRQRQRNMAPSPSKVDIKNWEPTSAVLASNEEESKGKKFLPSVKALRNQFENGKPVSRESAPSTSPPSTTLRRTSSSSSSSSLVLSSLDTSSGFGSLTSSQTTIETASIHLPKELHNDEPVEPIFSQFKGVDEELRELMSKPPSTAGWNPQPLLKRLYYIPEAPKMHSQGTTYVNIEGYLEKLPSGRKKATFWNAWKRRFFAAKDGILYYYQNNQTEKPSMKLPLMGGKIEIMEPNMISVDDGKGHYVVVRCSSRQEAERWKRALETHTVDDFSSQYVQPWPRPTNPTLLRDTLVIDIGSCSVRAGVLASQATLPQLFFPSVLATNRETRRQIWGTEALMPDVRSVSNITFPIRPSHKISKFSVDLTAVSSLLQKTFNDLKVDPKNYNIQLSVPRILNPHTQAELLKILFDTYGVKSVNLTHQSILALYAYNATSGIVVDIGERMDVVPVIDGYIVDGGVSRVPYGGYRIMDHLRQFLFQRNVSLVNEVESYVIRQVLETVCYCAQHYNAEKMRCTMNPENFEKSVSLSEFFPSANPQFDTFQDISLEFGRFQATEGLFNPDAWGLDHPGLHKLVHKAIQECSMDIRKEMSRSIFLTGGVTQLPGIAERLTIELDNLTPPAIRPKVHSSPYRYHAAYLGACVLAESPAFAQSKITKEEWQKQGNSALGKWSL